MRRLLLCVGLMLATMAVDTRPRAQSAPAAAPAGDELPPTWLEGDIGGQPVRMFVEAGGWPKDDGLWGAYYYTRDWFPLMLDGAELVDGAFRLYEGDPGVPAEGRPHLDLKLGSTVSGTWTSGDGAQQLAVRLRRTKQPPRYEAAVKTPRRFADPRWPMQLTYPAGWRLDVSETDLTLRSPDPQDTMFDIRLACERGRGVPPAPPAGGDATEFHGTFYRTHDGWGFEGDPTKDCDVANSCSVPRIRRMAGVTIMSGAMAYRAHNAWGYAGIGEATGHLVIDGDEWARCTDRLLDSDARIQPRPAAARRPR